MIEDLLNAVPTSEHQRVTRKIHDVSKRIEGVQIILPLYSYSYNTKRVLERRSVFKGIVQVSFARNVLIGLDYCKNVRHYLTRKTLLEDIIENRKIIMDYYQ